MRIVCISDTHLQCDGLELPEGDVLVHTGDHTLEGQPMEIYAAMGWLSTYVGKYKHVITIPGNHDGDMQKHPQLWTERFDAVGIDLLIDRGIGVLWNQKSGQLLKFYGSPWQPWWYDYAFNFPCDAPSMGDRLRAEAVARAKWDEIPWDTNVLLTHGPPKGILDKTFGGADTREGCPHLMRRIDQLEHLKLHAFGHLHESNGVERHTGHGPVEYGRTVTFVNDAICDRPSYAPNQSAHVVEI